MKPEAQMNEEKPNFLGVLIALGLIGTVLYYSIQLFFI